MEQKFTMHELLGVLERYLEQAQRVAIELYRVRPDLQGDIEVIWACATALAAGVQPEEILSAVEE